MTDLRKLAEPFPSDDIEWRVSRSGINNDKVWCRVFAYVTARAIQKRLDDVVGPDGWQLTQPIQLSHEKRCALGVGLSIRVGDEWLTRWDVCELTDSNEGIPPFKGGFSGAEKRAGAQWGIGRYLYYLDEVYAEVSREPVKADGWQFAKLSPRNGGMQFWWRQPALPGWALPKEVTDQVTDDSLMDLKRAWRAKFAADIADPAELREGFSRFVASVVGKFPVHDHECWTMPAFAKCSERLLATGEANGVAADVPFAR